MTYNVFNGTLNPTQSISVEYADVKYSCCSSIQKK